MFSFFRFLNQDSIRRQSELNFIERSKTMPVMIRADVATAHNYSAQSLNSTEIAKEKLRQELIKVMIFPTNKATIDCRRQFNAQ